jgi:hypothetical protein
MKERGIDKKQASSLVPENFGYKTGKEEQDYVEYLNDLQKRVAQDIEKTMLGEGVPADRAKHLGLKMSERIAQDPRKLADFLDESEKQMALHLARMEARSKFADAPFKKNWHELAMKRVLDYAADKGYDTVAITPGKTQAERYDLSKQIADLQYDPHMRTLTAWDHEGKKVISQSGISEEQLPNYIGKEAANNLLAKDLQTLGDTQVKQLFGADLEVGGEGMKGFYDQILPTYLNNLGKQYGASVGQMDLKIRPDLNFPPNNNNLPTFVPGEVQKVHSFDITPQMREEIKAKGLPLYGKIALPEVGTLAAGSGAATIGLQAPEQPLPPQMYAQPEYKHGGKVKRKVKFTNNPDTMRLELMSGKR